LGTDPSSTLRSPSKLVQPQLNSSKIKLKLRQLLLLPLPPLLSLLLLLLLPKTTFLLPPSDLRRSGKLDSRRLWRVQLPPTTAAQFAQQLPPLSQTKRLFLPSTRRITPSSWRRRQPRRGKSMVILP